MNDGQDTAGDARARVGACEDIVFSSRLIILFEAFRQGIPALVAPLQPEQAHNGYCAERLSVGARLAPSQPFLGNPEIYVEGLESLSEAELADRISGFLAQQFLRDNLAKVQQEVLSYRALDTLAVELAR